MVMASILVDYENVSSTDGLKCVEYLNQKDTLIIFYSQSCEKIRAEYIELIEKSKCEFNAYKLVKTVKNALDFYIASECGFLTSKGEKQIGIISKDKGFSAIVDFFSVKSETGDVKVYVAANVESVLLALSASEDEVRKSLIKEKVKVLNIGAEHSRIKEHKDLINKITKIFKGTEYENQTENILKFLEDFEMKGPKILYRNSLHEFGREDGRAIFRMVKNVVG